MESSLESLIAEGNPDQRNQFTASLLEADIPIETFLFDKTDDQG